MIMICVLTLLLNIAIVSQGSTIMMYVLHIQINNDVHLKVVVITILLIMVMFVPAYLYKTTLHIFVTMELTN